MTNLWRRAVDRLRQRDPEFDALRRAVRAALVLPVAAAVGFAVGDSQTALFSIFGSVALLIMVDFPETVRPGHSPTSGSASTASS